MNKNYQTAIKQLRLEKNISQSDIAQKMGISRTSYISFEQGKRDISLSEAGVLADIFGISLEDLKNGVTPNNEKYKQMILAFLRLDTKITKTKLAKLLYFADFGWFYSHLESMSGMSYRKMAYGPVSDAYFRIVDDLFDNGQIDIEQTKDGAMLVSQTRSGAKIDLSALNTEEKKLISTIEKKWKGKKTSEIVDFTHKQFPYLYAQDNEIVSYGLFTQENPDEIF
ncbi:MAG: type II toxin-antitoxin system antitoxin SocA domain-containing protein [Candidatus Magasanikbacteria bacterium]|jgi:transcriptional regulator with XRE-family HTH domain